MGFWCGDRLVLLKVFQQNQQAEKWHLLGSLLLRFIWITKKRNISRDGFRKRGNAVNTAIKLTINGDILKNAD